MRPDRSLRHFLQHVAPPVTPVQPLIEVPIPFEPQAIGAPQNVPVIIMPAPGSAVMDTNPQFPGRGIPPRIQDRERDLDAGWPRLARGGQALGKTSNFRYEALADGLQMGVECARVEGSDLDASQICVTLGTPAISLFTLDQLDEQALSGFGLQDVQGFSTVDEIDPDQVYPGSGSPPSWPPFTAKILWGTGGMQHVAYVDWVQGSTINLTASFASVTPVVMPDGAHQAGQSGIYRLGANIGPGWAPGVARRSVFIGEILDATQSFVFPVPPFARKVSFASWNDASPPIIGSGTVRFWQRSTPAHGVGDLSFNTSQNQSLDVPNAASYFTVLNQSGNALRFAAIFELAI